jgi:hypothetical protein
VPQQEQKRSEIAGIPLLWILVGAGLLFLLLAGLVVGVAGLALFGGKKDTAQPAQTVQPTGMPTYSATAPWSPPDDSAADEPPPPHHHPPPGHGKHKHKDEW